METINSELDNMLGKYHNDPENWENVKLQVARLRNFLQGAEDVYVAPEAESDWSRQLLEAVQSLSESEEFRKSTLDGLNKTFRTPTSIDGVTLRFDNGILTLLRR